MYEKIYGLNVTICRFYNVYGDYMASEGSYRTVLPIFLEQYKNKEIFTITGNGTQKRDFTHANDIVDAMIRMFPNPEWTYIDAIPGEMQETLCKSDLARKKLKWEPKINLEDWIKEEVSKCES